MDLDELRPKWTVDDIADVGRIIFESVPTDQRPEWAGAILLFVAGEEFLCDELSHVFDLSLDDSRWIEAHDAFQAVRRLTLQNERLGQSDSRQQLVIDIGETTAKIIYNAARPLAPFDYHAGWRMAPRVKRLVDDVNQPDFEDKCWRLLIRKRAHSDSDNSSQKQE
jgi:hypothetical protein